MLSLMQQYEKLTVNPQDCCYIRYMLKKMINVFYEFDC